MVYLLPNIINGHHPVVKGTSEAANVVVNVVINVVISEAVNVVICPEGANLIV
jgi:hypothetical protein